MLARVAETLYWTARDLERAENLARLLEASQSAALEGNTSNGAGGRLVWSRWCASPATWRASS